MMANNQKLTMHEIWLKEESVNVHVQCSLTLVNTLRALKMNVCKDTHLDSDPSW